MEKIEERRNQKTPKKPKKKFNWRIFLATILFIIAGLLFLNAWPNRDSKCEVKLTNL